MPSGRFFLAERIERRTESTWGISLYRKHGVSPVGIWSGLSQTEWSHRAIGDLCHLEAKDSAMPSTLRSSHIRPSAKEDTPPRASTVDPPM